MAENYTPLEKFLRELPASRDEVTLTFERVEQILNESLPLLAHAEAAWWGNQKQGTHVETIAWMNAGWMVDIVDLKEKWVRFVRQ